MSKEERRKRRMRRRAKRRWWVVGRELRGLKYECRRLLDIYFDDDEVKDKIRAEYMDKMIKLKVKRNLLKSEMEG